MMVEQKKAREGKLTKIFRNSSRHNQRNQTERVQTNPFFRTKYRLIEELHFTQKTTPRKINMEHNNGGLEDHFPF